MDTFAGIIDSAEGTLVFGNGVNAVRCTIERIGDDYLIAETDGGDTLAVPVAAVVYFRYSDDDA